MLTREYDIGSPDVGGRLVARINNLGQVEIDADAGGCETTIYLDAAEVKKLRAALDKIDDPRTGEG